MKKFTKFLEETTPVRPPSSMGKVKQMQRNANVSRQPQIAQPTQPAQQSQNTKEAEPDLKEVIKEKLNSQDLNKLNLSQNNKNDIVQTIKNTIDGLKQEIKIKQSKGFKAEDLKIDVDQVLSKLSLDVSEKFKSEMSENAYMADKILWLFILAKNEQTITLE